MNNILKPLSEDQINSDAWIKHANYYYSTLPTHHDPWEQKMLQLNPMLKRYSDSSQIAKSGVIFHPGQMDIVNLFGTLHRDGSYIIISRNRDHSFDDSLISHIPSCVKKIYAINTKVKTDVIEPIPVGCATSGGFSGWLPIIDQENIEKQYDKLVYCRLTLTNTEAGRERRDLVSQNASNRIFTIQLNYVPADEMFRNIKSHVFTACPAGEGKDCLRTYETITLGGIPIWSDCPELRHFEDLPVVYTSDWNLTEDWCNTSLQDLKSRKTSTQRMRMSYWDNHIQQNIQKFII